MGKPLYRRVYYADNVSLGSGMHIIDSSFKENSISLITNIKFTFHMDENNNAVYMGTYLEGTAVYPQIKRIEGVRIIVAGSWVVNKYCLTIEYIKNKV